MPTGVGLGAGCNLIGCITGSKSNAQLNNSRDIGFPGLRGCVRHVPLVDEFISCMPTRSLGIPMRVGLGSYQDWPLPVPTRLVPIEGLRPLQPGAYGCLLHPSGITLVFPVFAEYVTCRRIIHPMHAPCAWTFARGTFGHRPRKWLVIPYLSKVKWIMTGMCCRDDSDRPKLGIQSSRFSGLGSVRHVPSKNSPHACPLAHWGLPRRVGLAQSVGATIIPNRQRRFSTI